MTVMVLLPGVEQDARRARPKADTAQRLVVFIVRVVWDYDPLATPN